MVEIDHDSNSDEDEEQVTHVITEGEMLTKGLFIANYTQKQVTDAAQRQTTRDSTPSLANHQLCSAQSTKIYRNQRQKIQL